MKLRIVFLLFFSTLAYVLLISSRTGPASTFSIDRTGSPLSYGLTCGSCHGGAFNNASLTIVLKDNANQPVTSYTPGNTYLVEAKVASQFNFARGFQLVGLTDNNSQAGSFSSPGSQTKISPLNGRQYLEHSTPALSADNYVFTATWTAPTANTGEVTFYSTGVVANGNNSPSGDEVTVPVQLMISEAVTVPVELIDFRASRNENEILVSWETALEESFDNFEIERSVDGINFTKISEISSTGNHSKYNYTDPVRSSNKIYYRLRSNDLNGAFQYSEIIHVKGDRSAEEIVVFPNPTRGNTWIELPSSHDRYDIKWFDITGFQLGSMKSEKGQLELPFDQQTSGVYLISVSNGSGELMFSKRIVKL
ncbi:choice-of-anchor V domain-containing protein [Portibacter lacus]|uniref:T9SS C-terminal target domain-containing protein n=1 Tax=Portibacter lacus TaxID=1099794 RepID=A0AA37SK29_9BACT|nr:choice-of-anchor V domain-containing protein [Portibacter lacus]GLR15983.1 hypothetical protein GCM10007940_05980 [Portibacter lacus]